jgi:hypothetical protein
MTVNSLLSDEQKLQTLWDERAITHTMLGFARSLDVQDWAAHAACFTDPVNIDFKKFTGFDEVRLSPTLWANFAEVILAGAPRHHLLGTFRIDVNGDGAFASVDMISSLWTESESGTSANRQYGWFDVWFTRQDDEWRIARIKHDFQGVDGSAAKLAPNPKIAELSQQVFSVENMAAAREYLELNKR